MKHKVINLFGNNKIIPNNGVKYSELLEQFMSVFESDFKDYEYIEDIFDFAINAWNIGNMNVLIPNGIFKKTMASIPSENFDISLFKKMVEHKQTKYSAFDHFIVDFRITEANADGYPMLSVVTQESEAYIANMLNEEDDLHVQDDFQENYINRNAIVIKAQQPFFDWYSNLYPEDDLEKSIKETNIYLVDDGIDNVEKWLKKKFDTFFMMELGGWHGIKKEWPQRRNYKMFNLWFRVEISEMIYDLEKKTSTKIRIINHFIPKMKIPLSEFEQLIDERILKRGLSYFKGGAITDFSETASGEYEAIVSGTEEYTVQLEISNNIITEHNCDCPYDMGPVCKHVVASIFHLKQDELELNQSNLPKSKKKKTKSVNQQVKETVESNFTRRVNRICTRKQQKRQEIQKLLFSILRSFKSRTIQSVLSKANSFDLKHSSG